MLRPDNYRDEAFFVLIKRYNVCMEIIFAKNNMYDLSGMVCSDIRQEPESTEYAAATFQLNGKKIIFRVAKITPAKTGQFVAIWKRNYEGITAPFESTDDFDCMIITTRKEAQVGQFIFPKSILLSQGIISANNKEGKRGIRVYPPWDQAQNKQAQTTQQWQLNYFIDFSVDKEISIERLNALLQN